MNPMSPPTQAPSAQQLLADPIVELAMDQAWNASQPDDATARHEEGGWIYMDLVTGQLTTRQASAGTRAKLILAYPPLVVGSIVVGTFHTHPNPTAEGWNPKPSAADQYWATS